MDRDDSQAQTAGYRQYTYVWVALLVLLGMTIAIARLELLANYSVLGSLIIATVKAGLVLTYFMHLRHEGWVVKGMLLLAIGALTLIIALTFVDTWYR
jgi:cytochrome c oxidase subunit 4